MKYLYAMQFLDRNGCGLIQKFSRMVKLVTFFMCAGMVAVYADTYSQSISVNIQQGKLTDLFEEIQKQSDYSIFYNDQVLARHTLTISATNKDLRWVLKKAFENRSLEYVINGRQITVKAVQDSLLTIRGTVYDTHEPPVVLPGVTVQVRGTNRGVTTDEAGNFVIDAHRGDVLVFSMVGFLSVEHPVTRSLNSLPVALQDDVDVLEEVVVTGLSEQQKKHIASSVATLNIESNIVGKPITQLSQALQGGVTGIQVNQASGMPGRDAAQILVRGMGTLGNSNPLILVDGVPMGMDDIDPVTVESITVLKDAAAASSYGSRAANGVIVITTKRGVPGRVQVTYDGYYGVQRPTFLPELVDGPTYMRMDNEAAINSGFSAPFTQGMIDSTARGVDPLAYPNTNWLDLITERNTPLTSHSVSVSGGNQVARFAITGNYLSQDGMVPVSDMHRYNLRANTSITVADNFVVNLDLLTNRTQRREPQRPSETGGNLLIEDLYRLPPNMVARYPDKDGQAFYDSYLTLGNPLAVAEQGGFRSWRTEVSNINLHPKWEVLPGLNLRGQFNYQIQSYHNVEHRDAFIFFDYETGNVIQPNWGVLRVSDINKNNYYFLGASADYSRRLGKHNLFGIAGYSQEQRAEGNWNQWSILSAYAKLNYAYDDRYLLEATIRMDGSSRFGPGEKYGYFPSVAVGWNVHNEAFMQGLDVVNNLKLRTSYGELGNQSIGLYLYQSTISASTGVETKFGNPDLTWEKVGMFNAGIDLGLFKGNKIEVTADYYRKTTTDMLMSPQVSLVGGISSNPAINDGNVLNKGWEVAVNYFEQFDNWSLSVRPGFTWNDNKITHLPGGPYTTATNASTWVRIADEIGYPIRSYRGYKTDGLLQSSDFDAAGNPLVPVISDQAEPGDIKYLDLDNSGEIDDDDITYIGNPVPSMNYFANLRLTVKNFDLEFLLQGTGKSSAMLTGMMALPLDESHANGTPTVYYSENYWTPERTGARFPKLREAPGINKYTSDFWLENGAYLRVKYIQAGYTFKPRALRHVGVNSLRVYLNAQNPITFKNMVLMDPESRGGAWTYPVMEMYTIGVNMRF